jgi:hypothetical protein
MLKGSASDPKLSALTKLNDVHGHSGSHSDFPYLAGQDLVASEQGQAKHRDSAMNVEGPLDLSFWNTTIKALTDMGIDKNHQNEMLVMLSGILFAGLIKFQEDTHADGSPHLVVTEGTQKYLDICASLWKIPTDDLKITMTSRSMKKVGSFGARGSQIMIAYDVETATANLSSIVKKLYADVFDWYILVRTYKTHAVAQHIHMRIRTHAHEHMHIYT